MKQNIFKSNFLYLLSNIIFIIFSIFLIIGIIFQFINDFKVGRFACRIILLVLSLITFLKLLRRKNNAILFINAFIILSLPIILYNSFYIYSTHYIYYPQYLYFSGMMIIYLIIVNKNKVDKNSINEIEEIGKLK